MSDEMRRLTGLTATEYLARFAPRLSWGVRFVKDPAGGAGYRHLYGCRHRRRRLKYALDFLDRTPEAARAAKVIETLPSLLGPDGSVPVGGGTADERLTALALSPRPHGRSRALFTEQQISLGLDQLEDGQQDDGGWTFDWAARSPALATEWRGLVTLRALHVLGAHGRIA